MHGHFMWRIAFRSVLWEAVYRGPSGWSADIDEMVVVRDPYTNTEYIDDSLSTEEQEVLCGTYHCLTSEFYYIHLNFIDFMLGSGHNAIKSWYMPPQMYEKSALNLGRWSTLTESSLFAMLDRTFTDQTHYPAIKRSPLPQADPPLIVGKFIACCCSSFPSRPMRNPLQLQHIHLYHLKLIWIPC